MIRFTKAARYVLIFCVVGVVVTVLVAYVQQTIVSTYNQNLPFVALGDHIKNRSTKAHLWLEELLAGDRTINFETNVLGELLASKKILESAYAGQPSELGTFARPTDEETKVILKQSIVDLEKLIAITRERWAAQKQVADQASGFSETAGANFDQDFDTQFSAFQLTLDRLLAHLKTSVQTESEGLNTLSILSIGIVFISLIFLCVLFFRLQSKSDEREAQSSKKLVEEINRVEKLTGFIEAVSSGDYDIELKSDDSEDGLTNTLVTMRDKLKRNAEDDRKRNWITTGSAQIGEILRSATSNSAELYDQTVRFIVKYTKSNQGGLFVLNEDDADGEKFLELMACYAFERKKYLTRKVLIGDGLVGQCFLEGERIHLLEIPQEYVSITSGLGGTNPNALLIVPLKINDKIYGVLELASFHRYQEFEIELVEKFAESLASTISNVRVNETTRLLLERTQQQAEEMKSQEEEIRQNMEELEATQEEMRRKQTVLEKELQQSQEQGQILRAQEKKLMESQDTLQAIVDHIPRAIFWKDKDLRFMGCNRIFAKIAGANSPEELIGKTDFDMAWSAQADAYRKDDQDVMKKREAKLDIEEVNVNSNGEESWVLTSKVPIINHSNEVVAILGMFEDITVRKREQAEVSRKISEGESAAKELIALKQLLEARKI
jgi:PAS domain S-box-containing protein